MGMKTLRKRGKGRRRGSYNTVRGDVGWATGSGDGSGGRRRRDEDDDDYEPSDWREE